MPDGVLTESGVAFEVDRLEMTGERLELSGRWYGVRGRRFMRPTLMLIGEDGARTRCLAELEDKPWAAEDGEAWHAAFTPDPADGDVTELELAVAPDIAVVLAPPPDLPRRPAAPRGRTTQPVAKPPAPPAPPARQTPEPVAVPRDQRRVEALTAERDELEAALSRALEQVESARSDAAAAQADAAAARDELRAAEQALAVRRAQEDLIERLQQRIAAAEQERAASRLEQTRPLPSRPRREPASHMFGQPARDGWAQRIAVLAVLLVAVVVLLLIVQSA